MSIRAAVLPKDTRKTIGKAVGGVSDFRNSVLPLSHFSLLVLSQDLSVSVVLPGFFSSVSTASLRTFTVSFISACVASQGQHFGCGQRFGYRIDDLVGVQAQIPAPSTSTIASSTMKTIIGSFARVVRNWTTQRTPLYG